MSIVGKGTISMCAHLKSLSRDRHTSQLSRTLIESWTMIQTVGAALRLLVVLQATHACTPASKSPVLRSLRLQSELSHAAGNSQTMPIGVSSVVRVLSVSYDGGKGLQILYRFGGKSQGGRSFHEVLLFAEAALAALVHIGGAVLPTPPTYKAIWTLSCVTHNVVTHASLDVLLYCFLEPHVRREASAP
jgi:hypothetical protein